MQMLMLPEQQRANEKDEMLAPKRTFRRQAEAADTIQTFPVVDAPLLFRLFECLPPDPVGKAEGALFMSGRVSFSQHPGVLLFCVPLLRR